MINFDEVAGRIQKRRAKRAAGYGDAPPDQRDHQYSPPYTGDWIDVREEPDPAGDHLCSRPANGQSLPPPGSTWRCHECGRNWIVTGDAPGYFRKLVSPGHQDTTSFVCQNCGGFGVLAMEFTGAEHEHGGRCEGRSSYFKPFYAFDPPEDGDAFAAPADP